MSAQTLGTVEELQAEVAALEASLTATTQKVEEDERRIGQIARRLDELAVGRFAQDAASEVEAVGLEEEQVALERDISIARGAAESYKTSLVGAKERLAEAEKAAARARYEELAGQVVAHQDAALAAARDLRDAHAELAKLHRQMMSEAQVFESNDHKLTSMHLYTPWAEVRPRLQNILRGLF